MSWQATTWVTKHSSHKGSALLTMLMLANHASPDGRSIHPGLDSLARDTRLSRRQVIRIIETLLESGELKAIEGKSKLGTKQYEMPGVHEEQDEEASRDKLSPGGEVPDSPVEVTPETSDVTDSTVQSDTVVSSEVALNRPPEPSKKQPSRHDPVWEALCAVEDVDWHNLNSGERGKIQRARKLATESGATAAQIMLAARAWPTVMGGATMSANGVMTNFQKLLNGRHRTTEPRTATEKFHARMEEALANGLEESGSLGGADGGVLSGALGDGAEHRDLDRGAAPAG